MVNLLIDITNMFYRSMFSTSNYGKGEVYTYDSKFECEQLMRKICMDVALVIRQTKPNKVMFCKDSKPWRKDIKIVENEGYKAQRKKSSEINWDNIYKTQNEFFSIMSKLGFIVCDINGAEADDIIAMWVEEMFGKQNESCIIVSGDEDIRQLIDSKEVGGKHVFVCSFNPIKQGGKNPTKKIYHDGKLVEWLHSPSNINSFQAMFNTYLDTYKDDVKSFVLDEQYEKVEVNAKEIALKKYLMGDDGDNIPAFYTWEKTTKAGKLTKDRITPKKYEKIVEELHLSSIEDLDSITMVRPLKSMIEGFSKSEMDVNIMERMQRQKLLVELKSTNFPEEIVMYFNNHKTLWLSSTPSVSLNIITMQDILSGTKYITEGFSIGDTVNPTNTSSVFVDMSKIDNIREANEKLAGLF